MRKPLASAFVGIVACVLGASPPSAAADAAVTSASVGVPFLSARSGVMIFNPVHVRRFDRLGPAPTGVTSYDEEVASRLDDPGGPSQTCTNPDPSAFVLIGPMSPASSARQKTTIVAGADSVVVESSANVVATKTRVPANCTFLPFSSARTAAHVTIEIARRCHYRLVASLSGDADDPVAVATASVALQGSGNEVSVSVPFGAGRALTKSASVSKEGVLDAGVVFLQLDVAADLGDVGDFRSGSQARASWTVSLSISPDVPGDDVRWTKRAGGTFGTDANWDTQHVPVKDATHADNAVFDLRGSYPVDFGAAQTSDRLEIRQGDVTFENADYTVDDLSLDRPSLIVDVGRLTLASGQLTSNSATIGDLHSVGAKLDVVGAGSRWDCLGRLRVGGSDGSGGDGELKIADGAVVTSAETLVGAGGAQPGLATVDGAGSLWTTGNIAVGFSSLGEVFVTGGARASSDEVRLGFSPSGRRTSSSGFVGRAAADGTDSEWDASTLVLGPTYCVFTVGRGGFAKIEGLLVIRGDLVVTGTDSSEGSVPLLACGAATIQHGSLDVGGGGHAIVADETLIGFGSDAGAGELDVHGRDPASGAASSFTSNGRLTVGFADGGDGRLGLTDGAELVCGGDADVGTSGRCSGAVRVAGGAAWRVAGKLSVGGEGTGSVVLDSGTITTTGDLDVTSNGAVLGNGTIVVGGAFHVDGELSPDVVTLAPLAAERRGVARRKTPAPPPVGTLTIQGNLVVGPTAVIRAGAAGARSDELIVTGDATLDGTLVLQFLNGFAPKTGDQFELFHVNGSTTGAFASVETRGLAAGAQFDVATTDGAFTVTATNDAVALPTVGVKASTKKLFEKRSKKKATITFSRKGATTEALTVLYTATGSAQNGLDYVQLAGRVTIPAKKRSAKIAVQLVNDPLHERAETIDVAVVPGDDYTQSLTSNARITIVDDD